jgi:AcrR family transcriptional regulator
MAALVDATIELIIEQGTRVSVRTIAEAAGVNHGLVHTYFGSKQGLIRAAFDEINESASRDLTSDGFPPADLANRRGGLLARATARMRLDVGGNMYSSHPILGAWRKALQSAQPDLPADEVDAMVVTASTLALGWAVFADQLCESTGIDGDRREELDRRIAELVAELGGIPPASEPAADSA